MCSPRPVPQRSPHPRYLYRPAREKAGDGPPVDTHTGRRRTDRHSQPQHQDLPATTAIYKATLEQSRFRRLVRNVCTLARRILAKRLRMLISEKLNDEGGKLEKNLIMDTVCIVWNCLQSRNGSSLSLSEGG